MAPTDPPAPLGPRSGPGGARPSRHARRRRRLPGGPGGAARSGESARRSRLGLDRLACDRRDRRRAPRSHPSGPSERQSPPEQIILDIDSTLMTSHSEKEGAPTYKRSFGFHPMLCYLDATGEALAGVLRPGNAGTNTAADHIGVLVDALNQLPGEVREEEGCRFLEGPRAHPRPSALRKNGARRPENPRQILGQNAVPWAILLTCVLSTTRPFTGKRHDQPKRPADVPHLVSHLHTRRVCRCWWCIRWCEVPERPLRKCPYRASGVGAGRGMRPGSTTGIRESTAGSGYVRGWHRARPHSIRSGSLSDPGKNGSGMRLRSGRTCGLWLGPRRAIRDSP